MATTAEVIATRADRGAGTLPVVGSLEQFDYGLRLLLHGIRAEAGRGPGRRADE